MKSSQGLSNPPQPRVKNHQLKFLYIFENKLIDGIWWKSNSFISQKIQLFSATKVIFKRGLCQPRDKNHPAHCPLDNCETHMPLSVGLLQGWEKLKLKLIFETQNSFLIIETQTQTHLLQRQKTQTQTQWVCRLKLIKNNELPARNQNNDFTLTITVNMF